MAFIGGGEAVAKLPGVGVLQGLAAGALWKSFETANQSECARARRARAVGGKVPRLTRPPRPQ